MILNLNFYENYMSDQSEKIKHTMSDQSKELG